MEDLLTSNVFGLLKFVAQEDALLPWLRMSKDPQTTNTLEKWLVDVDCVAEWQFWPQMSESGCRFCEPDLLLKLRHHDGTQTWLLVEAKYLSGKSSFADEAAIEANDQLAREFDNLRVASARENVSQFAVVFVTADVTIPLADIQASIKEYESKRKLTPQILWLSWRYLSDVIAESRSPILTDLRELLNDLDLVMFRRLRLPERLKWHFGLTTHQWKWNAFQLPVWQFVGIPTNRAQQLSSESSSNFDLELRISPSAIYRWRDK